MGVRKIEALGRVAATAPARPCLPRRRPAGDGSGDLGPLLDGVDIVVGCADYPSADDVALLVAQACVPRGTPHTGAGYAGSVARIGPTWFPRRRPVACHGCLQLVRERDGATWSPSAAEVLETRPRRAAVSVAQAQLVASLAIAEILHLRAGLTPATAGHVVALDLRTLRSFRSRVARQRDCAGVRHEDAGRPSDRRTDHPTSREEVSA